MQRAVVLSAHRKFLASQKRFGGYLVRDGLFVLAVPGIYHPARGSSSRFLLEALPALRGADVLEVGAGTGAVGLSLARQGNRVTLADIDARAVRCARRNAQLNGIEAAVHVADVFEGVPYGATYDVILFNLPFFQKPIEAEGELVACDFEGKIATRFIEGLPQRLRVGGVAYITYSNLADGRLLAKLCRRLGLKRRRLAREVDRATGVSRSVFALTASSRD